MDILNNDLIEYSKINNRYSFVQINGVNFPKDASTFFKKYNEGINDYIWFISPYSENWKEMVQELRDPYETLKIAFEQDILSCGYVPQKFEGYPFEFYPHPDGLIPWAYSDNGTVFYWKPVLGKWNIVVYGDSFEYYEYDFLTTEFLYKLINKEINEMQCFLPKDIFDYGIICK